MPVVQSIVLVLATIVLVLDVVHDIRLYRLPYFDKDRKVNMTPCEKLGLKVGDKAEVLEWNPSLFVVGSVVSLVEDDGSYAPYWSGISRGGKLIKHGAMNLSKVRPVARTTPQGSASAQGEQDAMREFCRTLLPIAQAALNGEIIEFLDTTTNCWRTKRDTNFQSGVKYRVKPRTIKVNGFNVPEPMRDGLAIGDTYWIVYPSNKDMYDSFKWAGDETDVMRLSRGICHTTKEAAIAHVKAMLGIDPASK